MLYNSVCLFSIGICYCSYVVRNTIFQHSLQPVFDFHPVRQNSRQLLRDTWPKELKVSFDDPDATKTSPRIRLSRDFIDFIRFIRFLPLPRTLFVDRPWAAVPRTTINDLHWTTLNESMPALSFSFQGVVLACDVDPVVRRRSFVLSLLSRYYEYADRFCRMSPTRTEELMFIKLGAGYKDFEDQFNSQWEDACSVVRNYFTALGLSTPAVQAEAKNVLCFRRSLIQVVR